MSRVYITDRGNLKLTTLTYTGTPGGTITIQEVGTNVLDLFQPLTPGMTGTYRATLTNGSYIVLTAEGYRGFSVVYYDRNGTVIDGPGVYGSNVSIVNYYMYVFCDTAYTKFQASRSNMGGDNSYYYVMLHDGDTLREQSGFYRDMKDFNSFFGNAEQQDPDPFSPGGNSQTGGGTGNFDSTSDTINIPTVPTITGLNTGFFTAFTPTQAQLESVSSYLWNNVITDILDPNLTLGDKIDALKKVVGNPYDAIMGCSLVPVTPVSGGSKEMKMFGVIETGITLPYASSRWIDVDCGTLNVNECWGAYLDYSPYTKTTSLYLPYIGTVSIDVDLIMNKALRIYYRVDILSGNCVAYILIDGSVKFSYQGNCAVSIPVTAADYSGAIHAGLGLVGSVANIVSSTVGGAPGGVGGVISGAVSSALSSAPSIAGNVMGMKPDIKSGGAVGGAAGFLGVQKPYLIIERPNQSVPKSQYKFTGYPLNMVKSVGDCSGYTEFDMILLDGITLTDAEKKELEGILTRGCYL